MGAPKRNRKKFTKPRDKYNLPRIEADRSVIKEYGLKNMHELWAAQTELSRLRGNVRMLLAGNPGLEGVHTQIVSRLSKLGIVSGDINLERLLDLKTNDLLERRLQSRVFRRGLARSMKQARQLITHGFVSIGGIKVDRPGYIVRLAEDERIGYYKPIEIAPLERRSVERAESIENAEIAAGSVENDNGVEIAEEEK